MENKVIKDENPIVDPIVDAPIENIPAPTDEVVADPVDTTLTPTNEVIPAPVDGDCTIGAECVPPVVDPVDPNVEGVPVPVNPIVTVAQFFGTLQESVTITWRFHLKTRKYHIHKALNEFYDAALDDVDDIIEQYQGINGVVEDTFVNCIIGDGKTEVDYLTELKNYIESNKHILGDHTEINSAIDTFLGHIDSAIYQITSFCENVVKSFDEFYYEELTEDCHCTKFGECDCNDDNNDGESCGEEEE